MATLKYRVCARCGRNRQVKFYAPRGTVCKPCQTKAAAARGKNDRLQAVYGITLDEYHHILAVQNGVCAICKGQRAVFDVDHSHAREKELRAAGMDSLQATRLSVRGLLCKRCNRRGLPAFQDNPDTIRRAAEYVEEPPAMYVILT